MSVKRKMSPVGNVRVQLRARILPLTAACPYGICNFMSANKMLPARYIREVVFGCATQEAFAKILKYEQATISRWETGTRRIDRTAQERIRRAAKKRRLVWQDSWFFEVPPDAPHPKRGTVSVPMAAAA